MSVGIPFQLACTVADWPACFKWALGRCSCVLISVHVDLGCANVAMAEQLHQRGASVRLARERVWRSCGVVRVTLRGHDPCTFGCCRDLTANVILIPMESTEYALVTFAQ